MGLFESHKMTVSKPVITTVDRQPVSVMEEVITEVPCRVTGTFMDSTGNRSTVKLYVLKRHYDTIDGGLHKNYKITIEGDFVQQFIIMKEPYWAGGTKNHIEALLEEYK